MPGNAPLYISLAGILVLVISVICSTVIFPRLADYLIQGNIALKQGSRAFEMWKKAPFPFKFVIHVFNVTNPDDVQNGAAPIFREMGPYVYDEFRIKNIISINEENDTVKYMEKKLFYFNKKESGCRSDNDIATIINMGVVGIANKLKISAPALLPAINDALPYLYPGIKSIFTTDTIKNILFDGMLMSCQSQDISLICTGLKSSLPPTIRLAENNRDFLISMFHHKNGTENGPYEMNLGLKNTARGKIVSFKDESEMPQWGGKTCNSIEGTDLTVNPPLSTRPEEIHFFAPDFCRSFSSSFQKKIEYEGIATYSFKSENLFANDCFCSKIQEENSDLPLCKDMGTMDVGPCVESPVILSQPHFMGANKKLLEYATGLAPNEGEHRSFITMEPKTGLALVVKTRIQMNVELEKIDEVDLLLNVSEGLFPILWLEEGAEVPPAMLAGVREGLQMLNIFTIIKYVIIATGVVLLVFALIFALIRDRIFSCKPKIEDSVEPDLPQLYQKNQQAWMY